MMHAGEERESKEERGVGGTFDWTVRPQWKLFHDPVRPFPHDVAGIFGRDSRARYLSPRNMAHPGRPGLPVYLETASRYSLPRTCPLSRLLPHLPGRNFSKILDAPTCSKGVRTLLHPSVSLPLSSSLSLFLFFSLSLFFYHPSRPLFRFNFPAPFGAHSLRTRCSRFLRRVLRGRMEEEIERTRERERRREQEREREDASGSNQESQGWMGK